jgi:hypothetical protein
VQNLDSVGFFVLPCSSDRRTHIQLAGGPALRRNPGSATAGAAGTELFIDIKNSGSSCYTIRRGETIAEVAAIGGGTLQPRVRSYLSKPTSAVLPNNASTYPHKPVKPDTWHLQRVLDRSQGTMHSTPAVAKERHPWKVRSGPKLQTTAKQRSSWNESVRLMEHSLQGTPGRAACAARAGKREAERQAALRPILTELDATLLTHYDRLQFHGTHNTADAQLFQENMPCSFVTRNMTKQEKWSPEGQKAQTDEITKVHGKGTFGNVTTRDTLRVKEPNATVSKLHMLSSIKNAERAPALQKH